ncbi:MAG: hypothetical protein JJU33_06180 [Phycisphaerales bacterium]|nr:hypothetical protein [Phycisphaerales bacterium]
MGWFARRLGARFSSGLLAAVCGVVLIGAGARAVPQTFTALYDTQVRDGGLVFGKQRAAIDRAIDLGEFGAERRVVSMQTPHNPRGQYARAYIRDRVLLDDGSLRIRDYELLEGGDDLMIVQEWVSDEGLPFAALPELVRQHARHRGELASEDGPVRSVHFAHGVFAEGIDWFASSEANEAWIDALLARDPDAHKLAPPAESPSVKLLESYFYQFDSIVTRSKNITAASAADSAHAVFDELFIDPADRRPLETGFDATRLVTGDWLTTTMERLGRRQGQHLLVESGTSGATPQHGRQFLEAVMHGGMHAGARVMEDLRGAIKEELDAAGAERTLPSTSRRGDDLVGFGFHYETEELRGFCRVISLIDLRGDARIIVTVYEHPK